MSSSPHPSQKAQGFFSRQYTPDPFFYLDVVTEDNDKSSLVHESTIPRASLLQNVGSNPPLCHRVLRRHSRLDHPPCFGRNEVEPLRFFLIPKDVVAWNAVVFESESQTEKPFPPYTDLQRPLDKVSNLRFVLGTFAIRPVALSSAQPISQLLTSLKTRTACFVMSPLPCGVFSNLLHSFRHRPEEKISCDNSGKKSNAVRWWQKSEINASCTRTGTTETINYYFLCFFNSTMPRRSVLNSYHTCKYDAIMLFQFLFCYDTYICV